MNVADTPKQVLCAVTNPFVTAPQLYLCRQEWVPDGAGNHTFGTAPKWFIQKFRGGVIFRLPRVTMAFPSGLKTRRAQADGARNPTFVVGTVGFLSRPAAARQEPGL